MVKQEIYRKNIAFIVGNMSKKGGAERVCAILANELIKTCDVTIISCCYTTQSVYELDSRIKLKYILEKNDRQRIRYIFQFKYIRKLRNIIKKMNVAIIVSSAIALITPILLGVKELKLITWEQTSFENKKYMTLRRKTQQILGIALSDYFVCLTIRNTQLAKNKMPLFKHKFVAIYNPIDENLLYQHAIYNINSNKIVTFARIDRVKGLELLVQVAEKVLNNCQNWQWYIYGSVNDKEYFIELKKYVQELGLSNKLHFCTPVNNIAKVLNESAIFVMTSLYEGMPMSLLEAKAMKLPLISFDCPTGPSEIIQDGIDGDLISCYDVDDMAIKLKKLINNTELRKQYSEHAWDNIESFRMKKIIRQWISLFDSNK